MFCTHSTHTHRTPQCTVYLKSTIIVSKGIIDFVLPLQKFAYTVKIYDPERRSKFTQRDLYSICHRFQSVKALRSALYHELEYEIPDGDYNVGYFEGSHHKKWLVSSADLEAMYAHFKGKKQIPLWCDGRENATTSGDDGQPCKKKRKTNMNESMHMKKVSDREEELESVFQKLREKHGSKWSGPQYRLWARAMVSGVHNSDSQPPNAPMFTGGIQKQPKESLVDAFAGAATAVAKAFSPKPHQDVTATEHSLRFSPGKKVDIRMKNLEQLRVLQSLMEDGILNKKEFTEQKRIVLQSLNNLI